MANPLCPYFNQCGGCTSQHIDYSTQLDSKRKRVASLLNFIENDIFVSSDKEYSYRNRMDFIFHKNGIGLRLKHDWKNIVDVESCAIADEKINLLLKEIRSFFVGIDSFDILRKNGTFRYAVIRTPQNDSSISFVLNEDSNKLSDAIEKIKSFAKMSSAKNILVTYVPANTDLSIGDEFFVVKGNDMLCEQYFDKKFFYSVQGFFQNNTPMAIKMHEYVSSLVTKHSTPNQELLDLYCGVGTFGIINSNHFKNITLIENDKHCIDAATQNLKANSIVDARAFAMDASGLKKILFGKDLFIITDPPRSGMHPKTIDQIKRLSAKTLIYISCNPEQLAKELKRFSEYELRSVAIFDLFPQTSHVETVVELVRK